MFARKLNHHLEKHIHSFLVEGNLDLIYTKKREYGQDGSTLSSIRSTCKGSKKITQGWQDKFEELKLFLADQDFKKFYLKTIKNSNFRFDYNYDSRNFFKPKDLIFSIVENMSLASNESVVRMLKNVLDECGKWEDKQDESPESNDVITKGKFALWRFYVNLEPFRQNILDTQFDTPIPPLDILQKQFKFLVLEQIVKLLFKVNTINNNQKFNEVMSDAKAIDEAPVELPVNLMEAKSHCQMVKWCSFCCILPLITGAILIDTLLPEEQRTKLLVLDGLLVLFCLVVMGIFFRLRQTSLQNHQLTQQYHHRFFEQLERTYDAKNTDEKTIVAEQKTATLSSDDENLEIRIDASSLLGEYKVDIKNAELRTPLLSKK